MSPIATETSRRTALIAAVTAFTLLALTVPVPAAPKRVAQADRAGRWPADAPLNPLDSSRVLSVVRAARPPVIGRPWSVQSQISVEGVSDFRQRQPGDGTPASLPTRAEVTYDEDNLYVRFECDDEPAQVRARLDRRESIADDDQVLVYLDTFRDRRRSYIFAVNPLGVQLDGMLTEGQGVDYTFDTVWRAEAARTPRGYAVLIAIPFRNLRFSSDEEQTWGIALGRYIAGRSEQSFWPLISNRIEGFANQFAELRGLRRISPGHGAQVIPYGVVTGASVPDAGRSGVNGASEFRGGIDVKAIVRENVILDITGNPDFAQVESDAPQVTVNQRFEVFFPERRPFFTENAGFFTTPEVLLFSRRIVQPQFGARLTAKAGGWAIGALASDDRSPQGGPGTQTLDASRRSVVGVVRVHREIGSQSYVGGLMTSQASAGVSNQVFAADLRLKFAPNWIATGQIARSIDRAVAGGGRAVDQPESAGGSSVLSELFRVGRHFGYSASFLRRSSDFRAALGFIPRVDMLRVANSGSYFWRPDRGPILAVGPGATVSAVWNTGGERQDVGVYPRFDV